LGKEFGEIIGTRKLYCDRSKKKSITVTLGIPRKMKDGDWECPFRITGLAVQYGYGVDGIQALSSTLEEIRVTLDKSKEQLSWVTGEPGDTGFERLVPSSCGLALTQRINLMIDREIARFVKALKRK
jgi:hypothetical protein